MQRIKPLLAGLALWAVLAASPALAAITQIVGTGVGGMVITPVGSTTNANTASTTTNVDLPPGSLVILGTGYRVGGGTINSCTDNAATPNTYIADQTTVQNGLPNARTFHAYITTDLPLGGTITCTYSITSIAQKDLAGYAFSGAASPGTADAASVTTSNTGTTLSVGPTGTLSCPGGGSGCEVIVSYFSTNPGPTVYTETGGFTDSGPVGHGHFSWLIVSAATAITHTPTVTMASSAVVGILNGYVAATSAAPANKLMFRPTP